MSDGPPKNLMGRLLGATGCVCFYKDGTGWGYYFRWWHPLSWLTWLIAMPFVGVLQVNECVPFARPKRLKGGAP